MKYNERLVNYNRDDVITFRKTKERYGGLSNMAPGYPIQLNGYHILTSEALYQALKYTDPAIQQLIINERSPMTAKMISKKYKNYEREDWEEIRISVMKWCLRVKLVNNWGNFGRLLASTENYDIVEESHKDQFWGAKPISQNKLVGRNYLGRLLKLIREEYRYTNEKQNYILKKLENIDLVFIGKPCDDISILIDEQKNQNFIQLNEERRELETQKNKEKIVEQLSFLDHS